MNHAMMVKKSRFLVVAVALSLLAMMPAIAVADVTAQVVNSWVIPAGGFQDFGNWGPLPLTTAGGIGSGMGITNVAASGYAGNTGLPGIRSGLVLAADGGKWDVSQGWGSSWAATNNAAGIPCAVGYLNNTIYKYGLWRDTDQTDGASTLLGNTLVGFTYAGDADLNGRVNTDDLLLWLNGIANHSAPAWDTGDWDYNNLINTDDLLLWLKAAGRTPLYNLPTKMPAPAPGVDPVPEPSTFVLILSALGVLTSVAVRRRSRG
jgi:hypothetical protein